MKHCLPFVLFLFLAFPLPALAQHGGKLELVDIKDNLVYVQFHGACRDCASANQTLKLTIEQTLKEQVDERIRVVAV